MTVRLLDDDGDITTSGVQFTTRQAEIAQTIRTRLRLFLGEYFRDITDGTPWFETVFPKNTTIVQKEAALKRRILNTPGVNQILIFQPDYDVTTRVFSVTAAVLTKYGVVELTQFEEIANG